MLSFFECCDGDKESSRLSREELVPQFQSRQECSTSIRATQLFALYVFTPGGVCPELALYTQLEAEQNKMTDM